MKKLMKLNDWRMARFCEPRPSQRAVRYWAERGDIPAFKRGKLWFVDVTEENKITGNSLVDDVLRAG